MKLALICDTHFCFKRSNKIYHDYFERFYNEVFFPTLQARTIDSVVHLGDAFDNRKGVDYWGLEWAQRVFYDRLSNINIQLYQICGNHDAEKKTTNKYNAIDTLLRDYTNVTCITEPKELTIENTDLKSFIANIYSNLSKASNLNRKDTIPAENETFLTDITRLPFENTFLKLNKEIEQKFKIINER